MTLSAWRWIVFTAFFQRVKHKGYPSRSIRPDAFELTVEDFKKEILEHPSRFQGFGEYPDVTLRWLETHLMDMVNRGKPDQAVAAPRPLHGMTYLFRNIKRSVPTIVPQQLYEMLYNARTGGTAALDHLSTFFFEGYDLIADQENSGAILDVETQTLLNLDTLVKPKRYAGRQATPRELSCSLHRCGRPCTPPGALLLYGPLIPRSVMVEYIKILFAFHLALYHLRLFKLLPALVKRQGGDPVCDACPMRPGEFFDPQGGCPYQIGLLLDAANRTDGPAARLAEKSADVHFRRIAAFIKANFINEFAEAMRYKGKLPAHRPGEFISMSQVMQIPTAAGMGRRAAHVLWCTGCA